ncbi:unnamed protein product [Ceutorhynchus assimilis]|uniref:Acyl-CoA synthetase n=1 Tax=Ceutorhynchus assimilis TaxID=467358 RepID=A0A9N9QMP5_9CUCU|nr:unnamed protein product [Ceutorhynchus assimilis]
MNNKSLVSTTGKFYNDATSGTTGKPKGVILTHENISTQVEILTKAWKWNENDTILHTLPLHHVHGIINALFCPLSIGATTIMMPKFNSKETWQHLLSGQVTVFMAVPTIYAKLIDSSDSVKKKLTAVRLMVSGSAPLPVPLYNKWLEITGHRLLERYGMTEIGMCLSNLYDSDREPGYVGLPLPSVTVAIANDNGEILLQCSNINGEITVTNNQPITGELLVKGDSVFKEYYNKPTSQEFQNGWFKTGDICQYINNKFRMLGRKSADIIKSGGYKISALQIETILVEHPSVKECVVFGLTDDVYGERVTAVIVPTTTGQLTLQELKAWATDKMPKYWIPSLLKVVEEIPKNAMGKRHL